MSATVTLKKADKLDAIEKMIRAKYQQRYDDLEFRRREVAKEVYDQTLGKEGWQAMMALGKNWRRWVQTRKTVKVPGLTEPWAGVETSERKNGGVVFRCVFSGRRWFPGLLMDKCRANLHQEVPWPSRVFEDCLEPEKAYKRTQTKLAKVAEDVQAFNEEVSAFYDEAYEIAQYLRTSKQVDDRFPELWKWLPAGCRERIKQGVIKVDQRTIDDFREKLPEVRGE